MSEWRHDQLRLIMWCRYYNYVYQLDNKPSDNIIKYDILLDKFMREMKDNSKIEDIKSKVKPKKSYKQVKF